MQSGVLDKEKSHLPRKWASRTAAPLLGPRAPTPHSWCGLWNDPSLRRGEVGEERSTAAFSDTETIKNWHHPEGNSHEDCMPGKSWTERHKFNKMPCSYEWLLKFWTQRRLLDLRSSAMGTRPAKAGCNSKRTHKANVCNNSLSERQKIQ